MKSFKKTSLAIGLVIATLTLSGLTSITPAVGAPLTFTVNTTGDSPDATDEGDGSNVCETSTPGECTLRAAIETANQNPGADTIEFNIAGDGVHLIQPGSELPDISEALTIDGYTNNPGATPNTAVSPEPINSVINIEIDHSSGQFWAGLTVSSDDVTIRGFAIEGFVSAILVDGSLGSADNISIEGNFLGTDASGQSPTVLSYSVGVYLNDGCSNITIGGTDPSERNIITASGSGIETLCSNVSVFGNYIGVGRDGVNSIVGDTPTGGVGIVQPLNQTGPPRSNLVIGGPATGQGNVIAGIPGSQIVLAGIQNTVQGNIIGGDYTGAENANLDSGTGISLYGGGSNILIGGTGEGEGNTIVGTKGAAIANLGVDIPFLSMSLIGQKNAFLGNRIFEVGILDYYDFGDSNIGIDLLNSAYDGAPSGPPETFTDTGPNSTVIGNDTDRANNYLRAPILNSAVQVGDNLAVDLDLDVIGSDSNAYRVEFFSNDESTVFGYGPGQNFLGAVVVDTGNSDINLELSSNADITNKALSTTVTPIDSTGPQGFGGTSEFSQNIEIGSATDFDADGISDVVEDGAPNSGDANDDGIQDSQQPRVSSYEIGSTYVSFTINDGCSANGSVISLNENSLEDSDQGFTYPFGLTDFSLNCSVGNTVEIEKIVFTDDTADGYSVRKYRPNTHTFEAVTGSNVEEQTIGGESALVLTYEITDGGSLDDDGIANGIILDPVGLAQIFVSSTPGVTSGGSTSGNSTSGTLAATGNNFDWQTPVILMEIGLILLILSVSPKRRKALID